MNYVWYCLQYRDTDSTEDAYKNPLPRMHSDSQPSARRMRVKYTQGEYELEPPCYAQETAKETGT